MRKAFTLIELVVAIAILIMVVSFAGVIFKFGIGAYRTGVANAEIMQKLRAITDQLNADFKGVRKDSPIGVYPGRVVFFANGDFQSIGQYPYNPPGNIKTVAGNIACIFYGQAANSGKPQEKILVRRQTILTDDPSLIDPNALGEYFDWPLYAWKQPPHPLTHAEWIARPTLDAALEQDLVMYMAKGVDDFKVYVADWNDVEGRYRWGEENTYVDPAHSPRFRSKPGASALKFSFKLYDSKAIIRKGRRFTHIIYLGD